MREIRNLNENNRNVIVLSIVIMRKEKKTIEINREILENLISLFR